MLNDYITINRKFQSSINLAFDYGDDEKIESFIPTPSACDLIDNLTSAASDSSTQRAKVLVGAYGRGKSHAVLMAASLLSRKDEGVFSSFLEKCSSVNSNLGDYLREYVTSNKKLLPVFISGTGKSLVQSFLYGLDRALRGVSLEKLMPQTNYQLALESIRVWKDDYPETYSRFKQGVSVSEKEYIAALESYDQDKYQEFIDLYPQLTSGSEFNVYKGLNPVEVYARVATSLSEYGYSGIYVVYDEFSKFLESNIATTSIEDIKLLQDFAEACTRSYQHQMHLVLICHKDISNYIDEKLPKLKVDGWRGVSGRFEHIETTADLEQSYELIDAVVDTDREFWSKLNSERGPALEAIKDRYLTEGLFRKTDINRVCEGCYPLHPVTTYMLPRVSERVAQNERTLFTFMASEEKGSLPYISERLSDEGMPMVSPACLYDYFEPLFRKEPPNSDIRANYAAAHRALSALNEEGIETAIIKTICLCEVVKQYERLVPTKDAIVRMMCDFYSLPKVEQAIERITTELSLVFVRRSDGRMQIKESSGINIEESLQKEAERERTKSKPADVLNEVCRGKAFYPSAYNSKHEIVRYFSCKFISGKLLDSKIQNENEFEIGGDGCILAIIPDNQEESKRLEDEIKNQSSLAQYDRVVFVLPKRIVEIEDTLYRYKAAITMLEDAGNDKALRDELGIAIEDYSEVIRGYVNSYFNPELQLARYCYAGQNKRFKRRSQLSGLLSDICEKVFSHTPVINNEAMNKNEPSGAACSSRTKILNGLCAAVLEPKLGLLGTGQEVSIMRGVFYSTGVIGDLDQPEINVSPSDEKIRYLFGVIEKHVQSAKPSSNLGELYSDLAGTAYGIGLKRGLIVLFLAAYLRSRRQDIVIYHGDEEQKFDAETFNNIQANPSEYRVEVSAWDNVKQRYIESISGMFEQYYNSSEVVPNGFEHVNLGMSRWYLELPRFAKTATEKYFGLGKWGNVPSEYLKVCRAIKNPLIGGRERLFTALPEAFGCNLNSMDIVNCLAQLKTYMDAYVDDTIDAISTDLRECFGRGQAPLASLSTVIDEWVEYSRKQMKGHVLSGGGERIIEALAGFTNDERASIKRLCKAVTSLRIEDWEANTVDSFLNSIRATASAVSEYGSFEKSANVGCGYVITLTENGNEEGRRSFERVECSPRAKLLKNEISTAIQEMGESISDSEIRQVLMDVLGEVL